MTTGMHVAIVRHEVSLPWKIALPHGEFLKQLGFDHHIELPRPVARRFEFFRDLTFHSLRIETRRVFEGHHIYKLNHADAYLVRQFHNPGKLVVVRRADNGVNLDFRLPLPHFSFDAHQAAGVLKDLFKIGAGADLLVGFLGRAIQGQKDLIDAKLDDAARDALRHEGKVVVEGDIDAVRLQEFDYLEELAVHQGLTDAGQIETFQDSRIPEVRSEEHTSELQSHHDLVCRLLLEKKKKKKKKKNIISKKNKTHDRKINMNPDTTKHISRWSWSVTSRSTSAVQQECNQTVVEQSAN